MTRSRLLPLIADADKGPFAYGVVLVFGAKGAMGYFPAPRRAELADGRAVARYRRGDVDTH
jgi:hypothetical protein